MSADGALAQFGARIFDKLFAEFCDGAFEVELFDFIQIDAVKAGLVEKTKYDPEIHDGSEYCDPGDEYFVLSPLGRAALAKARGDQ